MVEDEVIAGNLALVRERIAESAARAGRDPHNVMLVAVSKTMPVLAVAAAYRAGVRHFGENRVQEAERKIAHWHSLEMDLDDPARWHLIGHLQTNKARSAAELFAIVQSIDSLRVAAALSRDVPADSELPVLLEVNISGEESKSGFALPGGRLDSSAGDSFLADAAAISQLPGLCVEGLMTVAPLTDDPETVRPHFRALRTLRDQLRERVPQSRWRHLSMGMTGDYQVAVEEGATIVRIGRAIFGERIT